MRKNALLGLVLAIASGAVATADELVLPVLAVNWPGRAGNVWRSEVYLTNPGPSPVTVSNGRFLPGTLKVNVPCYPPIAAFHTVAPYSTVLLSAAELGLDLQCPLAALGGMAFEVDGPAVISSRIVNTRAVTVRGSVLARVGAGVLGLGSTDLAGQGGVPVATDGPAVVSSGGANAGGLPSYGKVLSGIGQEVRAFGPADLAAPGVIYQLPGLVLDPFPCSQPAFVSYLYLANPGAAPVDVSLQQSRDGQPGHVVVNGVNVATPYTFTVGAGSFLELDLDDGGPAPAGAACMPPQLADLFFTATGPVAAVASVVDRSSQDARTVNPVPTSN